MLLLLSPILECPEKKLPETHRDRNLVRIPANISDGQIRNDQVTALTHKNIFHSFRMVYQQLYENKW